MAKRVEDDKVIDVTDICHYVVCGAHRCADCRFDNWANPLDLCDVAAKITDILDELQDENGYIDLEVPK